MKKREEWSIEETVEDVMAMTGKLKRGERTIYVDGKDIKKLLSVTAP